MDFKTGLFLALAIGCTALSAQPEDDMSTFLDHVDVESRIVGGNEAADGSHPHMVSLTDGLLVRHFVCGGSLISTRTVLTAAHCIDTLFTGGSLSSDLRATVGTNRWKSGGQTYTIARNVTHPYWMPDPNIKNDVGLLITSTEVFLSNLVQLVALSFDFVGANVPVRVAGWGLIKAGGSRYDTLQELNTTTIDGQQCVAEVAHAAEKDGRNDLPHEPKIELCTFRSVGRGACTGDSGSALVRTDTHAQVGVLSWGFPCAVGAPDVFARVSAFKNWIQENTV